MFLLRSPSHTPSASSENPWGGTGLTSSVWEWDNWRDWATLSFRDCAGSCSCVVQLLVSGPHICAPLFSSSAVVPSWLSQGEEHDYSIIHTTPDLACELRAPGCAWAMRCLLLPGEVLLVLDLLFLQQTSRSGTPGSVKVPVQNLRAGEGPGAPYVKWSTPSRGPAYQGEEAFANVSGVGLCSWLRLPDFLPELYHFSAGSSWVICLIPLDSNFLI